MTVRLSRERIDSFCGNVLPLRLLSSSDLSGQPISWRVEGESVALRTFSSEADHPFSDGVLLTLTKPGLSSVFAEWNGESYCCPVSVRPMKTAASDGPFQYYIGDFHDHTTTEHNHDRFAARETGFPIDLIRQIRDENRLDFHVVSDHASTLNPRDFFRGFADEEAAQPMELIVFPGSESEVSAVETDRYGYFHKNSGEIVTVNASNFSSVRSWDEFYREMEGSPFAVCALAHPQIVGWSVPGIWNFSLHRNNTPRLKNMVKMVEMGNGGDRESNQLNEYIYSVALDNGFRVSTTCSSDCHGPRWGYDVFPGKTIIMAQEKSKEAFLDAMLHNRIYACESGNLKLKYTVNKTPAPCNLAPADIYDVHLEIDCFREDESTLPIRCQLISDGGKTVFSHEGAPFSRLDFSIESDSASYFYLRLMDSQGRKTWSPPVYTGRRPAPDSRDFLISMDKSGCTATDETTGLDASLLLCDDPSMVWTSEQGRASILIDMKEIRTIAGFSHYPFPVTRELLKGSSTPAKLAEFPSEYRVSVSTDGKTFSEWDHGVFRIFGGEEIIPHEECEARYVRLEILSTVGCASGLTAYKAAPLTIGEITIYARK